MRPEEREAVDRSPAVQPSVGEAGSPAMTSAVWRSRLYRFLADAFRFPSSELHESLRSGRWAEELLAIATGVGFDGDIPGHGLDAAAASPAELEAEYLRLFEVGTGAGPPCPLYGGEYRAGSRMKVMEELVRFYEHFGLALPENHREMPDHATVELEFMHYLTFLEAAALQRGGERLSYLRAQRDFLERHLGGWLPCLRRKLSTQCPHRFFEALVAAADELVRHDLARVRAAAAAAAGGASCL